MDIERAKQLKVGDKVSCPADRGDPAYSGTVTHTGGQVQKNFKGTEYMWVTVKRDRHSNHVWPSNRLG